MRVLIPSPLFSYTKGRAEVTASGPTLAAALADLDRQFPGLAFRIVDEHARVRPHVRMWVGSRLVDDLSAPLDRDDVVMIVAALTGG